MPKTAEEKIMESLQTLKEWALQGMPEKDMAECLGIGYSTFRKIKGQNVALLALLKQSAIVRKDKDKERVGCVEKSLFERAKGYDYEVTEYVKLKSTGYDQNGKRWEKEEVVEKPKKIHVPADIQAAKFFLINKAKKEWKDNPSKLELDKEALKIRQKESEAKEW